MLLGPSWWCPSPGLSLVIRSDASRSLGGRWPRDWEALSGASELGHREGEGSFKATQQGEPAGAVGLDQCLTDWWRLPFVPLETCGWEPYSPV